MDTQVNAIGRRPGRHSAGGCRTGGQVRYAIDGQSRARALHDDCLTWLPRAARLLMPVHGRASRRWLRRSSSPYIAEIEAIAEALGLPGIWFLNGSYEWGCTALARDEGGVPWIARTLDWPFPGLGRHVEMARMRGEAGEFYNVTWPGYVGALTAMAPGRFAAGDQSGAAAAANADPVAAPGRHGVERGAHLAHPLGAARSSAARGVRDLPEFCRGPGKTRAHTDCAAGHLHAGGLRAGERCVIERTEDGFATRTEQTSAANDWWQSTWPWEARVSSAVMLTRTYDEAAANSRLRRETLAAWAAPLARDGFAWVAPPVLNPITRIAVEMCAANGTLRVAGYEREGDGEFPRQVTQLREIALPARVNSSSS